MLPGNGDAGALALAACVGLLAASPAEGTSSPVVGWGYNGFGQATPAVSVTTPAIAAGSSHSCAVQSGTGAVLCWGYDGDGQATTPASVNGTSGTASAIAAGGYHTLAIAVPEPGFGLSLACGIALLAALNSRKKNQLAH